MFEKILVALDGSQLAEQAIPPATELAKAFGSEVVLITVCETEEIRGGQACNLYINDKADGIRRMFDKETPRVNGEIVLGTPDKKILSYAESKHVDLVVMVSHGKSGIRLWPLGSTVDKVLRRTGVPLLVIRAEKKTGEAIKLRLFGRILVPLDGSERAAKVLPYMVEIAKKIQTEIILFHAIEPGRHVHTVGGITYIRFKDQDIKELKAKASDYLNSIAEGFAGTKAKVNIEVREGDSAEQIIKLTEDKKCSLIALSSHGHSGIEAWVVGSVTHKIMQASNKSVFFVPALE